MLRPVCMVVPTIGESIDHFMQGEYEGSVDASIGGVPFVGSLLEQVVPTESAVEAVEGAANQGSGGATGQLSADSISSQLPGS